MSQRTLVAVVALALAAADCKRSSCDFEEGPCGAREICAFLDEGRTECVGYDERDEPLAPPFEPDLTFWCSQGGHSKPGRSHSFAGDVFALDLATPSERDDVKVLAPMDGVAYVYDECEERDSSVGAVNDSRCGLGYGNHVKIWDGKHLVLLGHLARVTTRTGARVARHDVLGVMGNSGAAGSRHVHLTVSTLRPGDDLNEILSTPGWKGSRPVRYRMAAKRAVDEAVVVEHADTLPCSERQAEAVLLRP